MPHNSIRTDLSLKLGEHISHLKDLKVHSVSYQITVTNALKYSRVLTLKYGYLKSSSKISKLRIFFQDKG